MECNTELIYVLNALIVILFLVLAIWLGLVIMDEVAARRMIKQREKDNKVFFAAMGKEIHEEFQRIFYYPSLFV